MRISKSQTHDFIGSLGAIIVVAFSIITIGSSVGLPVRIFLYFLGVLIFVLALPGITSFLVDVGQSIQLSQNRAVSIRPITLSVSQSIKISGNKKLGAIKTKTKSKKANIKKRTPGYEKKPIRKRGNKRSVKDQNK